MKIYILFTKDVCLKILNGLSIPYAITDNIAVNVYQLSKSS